MSKLFGYKFEVHYKPSKENPAADVLSRVHCSAISVVVNEEWEKNMEEIRDDPVLVGVIQDLKRDPQSYQGYSFYMSCLVQGKATSIVEIS